MAQLKQRKRCSAAAKQRQHRHSAGGIDVDLEAGQAQGIQPLAALRAAGGQEVEPQEACEGGQHVSDVCGDVCDVCGDGNARQAAPTRLRES